MWLVSRGFHGRSCVALKRTHGTSLGRRFSDGELLSRCTPCPQWQDFRGVSYSSVGGSSEESDLHPLVEALVRVDPLAGAPALDACLKEGEQASSPVEKAGALSVMLTGLC